jgi:hypothetical protein
MRRDFYANCANLTRIQEQETELESRKGTQRAHREKDPSPYADYEE